MNKKTKKGLIIGLLVIIAIVILLLVQFLWINSRNSFLKEANSVQEAQTKLKNTDLGKGRRFEKKDFYGEYLPNTSFIITYKNRILYDQGYYMVYKENYKPSYCVDPLKTAWTVKNKNELESYNNHEYGALTKEQQQEVSKLILATQNLYNDTNDSMYLVAGQLLIWQAIGAELNDYTTNLQLYMDKINAKSIITNLDNMQEKGTIDVPTKSQFLYYDTSGQDLIAPVINPDEPGDDSAINIKKTSNQDGTTSVKNGEKITYKINVTNNSSKTQNITVTDPVKDSNIEVDPKQKLIVNGQTSNYTIKNLRKGITFKKVAPHDTIKINYTVIVNKAGDYQTGDAISNIVTACNKDLCEKDIDEVGKGDSSVSSIKTNKSVISNGINSDVANPGDELTYTISVQNIGDVSSQFTLTDPLSDTNIVYDDNGVIESDRKTTGTFFDSGYKVGQLRTGIMISDVKPNEIITFRFKATVKSKEEIIASKNDKIKNMVTVCADKDDCDNTSANITTAPLEVEKNIEDLGGAGTVAENGIAEANETLKYTIKITNNQLSKMNYNVKDNFADTNLVIDYNENLIIDGEHSSNTIRDLREGFQISIEPGQTKVFEFTVRVMNEENYIANAYINNIVKVCPEKGECKSSSAVIATDGSAQEPTNENFAVEKKISETVNPDGEIKEGENLTFQFAINNDSDSIKKFIVTDPMTDVNIDYDNSLSQLLYSTTINNGKFISPAEPTVENLKSGIEIEIDPFETFEFSFTANVKNPLVDFLATKITNTAIVKDEISGETITDQGIKPMQNIADFVINKKVTDANGDNVAQRGEKLSYDIEITNTGGKDEDITLKDILPSTGVDFDKRQVIQIKDISGNVVQTTTIEALTNGITIKSVPIGSTLTISLSGIVSETADSLPEYITNIANICFDKYGTEKCKTDNATISTTNPEPVDPTIPTVVKNIKDDNEDGIAQAGEKLTFELVVVNSNSEDSEIKVTDKLIDPNIVYNKTANLNISQGNGTFTNPTNPIVGDLESGITLTIPAHEMTTLEFKGNVKAPVTVPTPITIANKVEVCNLENKCTTADANLPIEGTPSYNLQKGIYVNGDHSVDANSLKTVVDGDKLEYEIKINNTGNTVLENMTVKDLKDSKIAIDSTEKLNITSKLGNPIATTPANPTIGDLQTGIKINTIAVNEQIVINYNAVATINKTDSDKEVNITNIASACVDTDCSSDSATVTTGDTVPDNHSDKISVLKEINEGNINGYAEPGENLTFKITINNQDTSPQEVNVNDISNDVNIDYEAVKNNAVAITGATNVTPTAPKISDLKSSGGINLQIPANSLATIQFNASVKNPLEDFTSVQITNLVNVTDEDGKNANSEATIPCGSNAGISVNKSVKVDGLDPHTQVAINGSLLEYTIEVINTNNTPVSNLNIIDKQSNIGMEVVDSSVTVKDSSGNTLSTTPSNPQMENLTGDGILVNNTIAPGQRIYVTYSTLATNVEDLSPSLDYLTNIATVCTPNPVDPAKGDLCASDDALVNINSTKPLPDSDIAVNKKIEETDKTTANNIAEPGERLTFKILVSNNSANVQRVKVQDLLTDPNIDYNSELIQKLNFSTNGETLTDITSLKTDPSEPTVQDLKNGFTLDVIPYQSIEISFTAKVTSPLAVLNASLITNTVSACDTSGCVSNGDKINITDTVAFDVTKTVDNLDDTVTGFKNNVNADPATDPTMKFKLTVTNTGNVAIEDAVLTDIADSNILTPNMPLEITSASGNPVKTTPNNPTTDDLFDTTGTDGQTGITIKNIGFGDTITVTYESKINPTAGTAGKNTMLTNLFVVNDTSDVKKISTNLKQQDTAIINLDPKTAPNPNVSILKKIEETGSDPRYPIDNIANAGEELKFTIVAQNTSNADLNNILIKDPLEDVNIDYDSVLASSLNIAPSEVLTNPTNPTVNDLKTGITISLKKSQFVEISFVAKVKSPLEESKNIKLSNIANICESGDCNNSGDIIGLPNNKIFEVEKSVEEDPLIDPTNNGIVVPNENLKYTIEFTNTQNHDLSNITINDTYAKGINFDNSKPLEITSNMVDNPLSGNPSDYTTDDLTSSTGIKADLFRSGETITISYDAQMESDVDTKPYSQFANIAKVCSELGCVSDQATVTTDSTIIPNNDFGVVKKITDENGDGIAQKSEKLNYRITVTNEGNTVQDLIIKDPFVDKNLDYNLSDTVTLIYANGDKIDKTIGELKTGLSITLNPGEELQINYNVKVPNPLKDTLATQINNTVTVTNADGEIANSGTTIPLDGYPDFKLTKIAETAGGDRIIEDGEQIKYRLILENNGNRSINNITFKDIADDNLIIDSTQNIIVESSSTQEPINFDSININDLLDTTKGITLERLDVGKKVEISYQAKYVAGKYEEIDSTAIANFASATSDGKTASDSNELTTDPLAPLEDPTNFDVLKKLSDKDLTNVSNNIADENDTITFHVYVLNKGATTATYNLVDELKDSNLIYDINSNGTLNDEIVEIKNGTIAAGENNLEQFKSSSGGMNVTIQPKEIADISYEAKVTSPYTDTTKNSISNNISICDKLSNCTNGGGHLDIQTTNGVNVEKKAIDDTGKEITSASVGEKFYYTITVKNTGNTETDIKVNDIFPEDYTVLDNPTQEVNFGGLEISPAGATITTLIENGIVLKAVPPGDEETFNFAVIDSVKGTFSNQAQACQLNTDGSINEETCDVAIASIDADDDSVIDVTNDFSVDKKIDDVMNTETQTYPNNADNIANPGERLRFSFTIKNNTNTEESLMLYDQLLDQNIDYETDKNEKLVKTLGNGEFINPTSPAVGDLKTTTGVNINLPANGYLKFEFYANVKLELAEKYNTNILNTIKVVDAIDNSKISEIDSAINLPKYERLSIDKSYTTTNITADGTNYLKNNGDLIHYTIAIQNIGTDTVKKFTLTDNTVDKNEFFENFPLTTEVTITTPDGAINTIPISDLITGYEYTSADGVEPGESVIVTFDLQTSLKLDQILEPNETVANIANVCYSNTFTDDTSDQVCEADGTNTPYEPSGNPVISNDQMSISKKIIDDNGDGEVTAGEKLTMEIYIVNNYDANGEDQSLLLTDNFTDDNLDYAAIKGNTLTITNETTGEPVLFSPNPPKVSDLEAGVGSGINITIPNGEIVKVSFEVNAKETIV